MQRQSLGSPGSRSSGGGDFDGGGGGEGDSEKAEKPIWPPPPASSSSRSSRTVHLIPIATLLCLLVLYLLSHDHLPSSDLPASGGERVLVTAAVSGSGTGRYLGATRLTEERRLRLRHRKEMSAHVRRP